MKRWMWISLACTLLLFVSVAGLATYAYMSLKDTANKIYEPLPVTKPKYVSKDVEVLQVQDQVVDTGNLNSFTVLLLGVDERAGDRGRSDTLIVMTVNPNDRKILMFNIPRDTRTEIVKRGTQDKINHAYAYDGVAGSLETVEHFLDMPIDYYVQVNMEGFKIIVDTLNGVNVNNAFAFTYEGSSFPKGEQHLSGEMALKYSRMRYDDPRGDFGRNDRQRQIVSEVLRRASKWNNALELPKILETIGNHVRTNLTFSELQDLVTEYRTKIGTIESTEIRGAGSMIGGVYYYIVGQEERDRLHEAMKRVLAVS